eukprot:4344916-Prymnesium_polylepis.5
MRMSQWDLPSVKVMSEPPSCGEPFSHEPSTGSRFSNPSPASSRSFSAICAQPWSRVSATEMLREIVCLSNGKNS